MKHVPHILPVLAVAAAVMAMPAAGSAACYAEYKAKRDNPLKLHYGIAKLSDSQCTRSAAQAALAPRLAKDKWILLSIVGFVDEKNLGKVRSNAGDFFLRY